MLAELLAPLGPGGQPVRRRGAARGRARTHWVEPVLVVDVDTHRASRQQRLRQPSYQGVRSDLAPDDLAGAPKIHRAARRRVVAQAAVIRHDLVRRTTGHFTREIPMPRAPRASIALVLRSSRRPPRLARTPSSAGAAVPNAAACSTSGTWTPGQLNIYWFDVDQGDSQLLVGPTGKTMLIDLGETAYNSKGTSTNATAVAAQIRSICGTGTNPVHLDYVMASHQHLDHIGYAGNPGDTTAYGNGLYQLLTPTSMGGLGFTVGTSFDHDSGTWTDANGNGKCDTGTSTAPAPEVAWHNVGTTSMTGQRFICWLYGPAGQADRANIEGKVVTLTNTDDLAGDRPRQRRDRHHRGGERQGRHGGRRRDPRQRRPHADAPRPARTTTRSA